MKCAIRIIPVLLLMLAMTSQSVAVPPGGDVPVRRYLLSAGANNGGKGRVMLRYAVSDANMFASVLIDMGGVEKNNALILANPSVRELLGGVDNLSKLIAADRAKAPGARKEVFIYYSGHADESGLKLGGETLSWAAFRSAVDGLNSDVKVAVVDACGSGAITRAKGGVAQPVFMSDVSSNMKGYAYLTSSNENEISQESDRIKGSFFTHALISGMRGAADMTGNGRVTVNEAYTYAFNETLQSTQNTRAGTQHPSRDMNLTGTGDIVMTDLRQTSATLSLAPEIEGRFFIWDANGRLFSELRKLRGRPIELGLPPGQYIVRMEAPSRIWSTGSVTVADGARTVISMSDMRPMGARARTVARGIGGDGVEDTDMVDDIDIDDIARNLEYFCGDYELPDELAAICAEELAVRPPASSSEQASQTAASNDDQSIALSDTSAMAGTVSGARPLRPALDSACAAPHRFNVNAIAASGKPESGVQLSFLNIASAEFCGTQAGLINTRHKDSRGVQIGIMNMSRGHFDGTQIAWWMNIASDTVGYVQGGAFNMAKDIGFVQGGAFNIARNVGYVQGGAFNVAINVGFVQGGSFNIARDVGSIQGGSFNIARDVGSIQGGAFNIARDIGALQGGAFNIARDVKFVQVGAFNIARSVEKAQAGVLNIVGKTNGRQVGVVNIARYSEKTPIGLLNIVGNGIMDVTALADVSGDMGVSLRTGMPVFYTLIESSRPDGVYESWPKTWGWGLGTRFGMNGPVAVNLDFVWSSVYDEEHYRRWKNVDWNDSKTLDDLRDWYSNYYKIRFGAAYIPTPFIAVTGGVSVNGHVENRANADSWKKSKQTGSWHSRETKNNRRLHAWPGLYAGVTVGKVQSTEKGGGK